MEKEVASMAQNLIFIAPAGAITALIFAFILYRRVKSFPEGIDAVKRIASAIRRGANAYIKRQYTGVALFFAVMFIILGLMAIFGYITPFVPFAFLTGGFFSA